MKKGFTLIEVMSVIIIMAILLLLITPIYSGVVLRIKQSMYETKVSEVLSKSEKYYEEKGIFVFDIKGLIEEGYLEPDNELGEFQDPRDDSSMLCDVITMTEKDGTYSGHLTESDTCYSKEELENLFGIVELILEDKEGNKIPKINGTDWLREKEVYIDFRLREDYSYLESAIEEVLWYGEQEIHCNQENISSCRYLVETDSVLHTTIYFEMNLNLDGLPVIVSNQKELLLDNVAPIIKNVNQKGINVELNQEQIVEFELSDGLGSGVSEYGITTDANCNSVSFQVASEGIQTVYLKNGDYYICTKDKVGNISDESDADARKITVTNVDEKKPTIESLTVQSTVTGYNHLTARLTIEAYDGVKGNTSGLKMCVSTTDYLKDCSWQAYSPYVNVNFDGTYDGNVRYVYVSVSDPSGNIEQKRQEYYVYRECSQTEESIVQDNKGTCPKCGVANYTIVKENKDKYLKTSCGKRNESIRCAIPSDCCSSLVYSSWSGWSACTKSCGGGTQYRTRTATSAYNGQSCGISGTNQRQEQACNKMDCCSEKVISGYGSWSSCDASCGGGMQRRDIYYVSKFNSSVSCGTMKSASSQTCNTQSCIQYRSRQVQNASLTKKEFEPTRTRAYNCFCPHGGSLVMTGSNKKLIGYTYFGVYVMNYYEHSNMLKCNPEKVQFMAGVNCLEYKLGQCVRWQIPPQYFNNTPSCGQDDLYTCPKGSTYSIDLTFYDAKCTKEEYSCPSGFTLSGTKCYGPWSAWSDKKVTASATLEVETRIP